MEESLHTTLLTHHHHNNNNSTNTNTNTNSTSSSSLISTCSGVCESWSDGSHSGAGSWDTSDPFFSAHTRELVRTVLKCYVRQVLVILGVPGNLTCCVVFFKQGLSDRVSLLLFWLAVADLTHLLTQLLLLPTCYLTDPVHLGNWLVICNFKIIALVTWSNVVSGILMVAVCVDRCLSVTVPFTARRLLTYRPMVAVILLSFLLPLLVCLPSFFAFTIRWTSHPSTNQSLAYIQNSQWFLLDVRLTIDLTHYFSVLVKPCSLVTVVLCSAVTVHSLRQASRRRLRMTAITKVRDKKKEEEEEGDEGSSTRTTQMLLFLCLVYIVLTIPETCSSITVFNVPEFRPQGKYHNTLIVMYQFVWAASCLNSTVNVFAYLVLSSRFRATLRKLCCCGGGCVAK